MLNKARAWAARNLTRKSARVTSGLSTSMRRTVSWSWSIIVCASKCRSIKKNSKKKESKSVNKPPGGERRRREEGGERNWAGRVWGLGVRAHLHLGHHVVHLGAGHGVDLSRKGFARCRLLRRHG